MNKTATHRLTSVLLAFVLAFSMFGITSLSAFTDTAFAEETSATKPKLIDSNDDFADIFYTLSGEYQLADYVKLEDTLTVKSNTSATINLNGNTIDGPKDKQVISIEEGASLTILDSTEKGMITGWYGSLDVMITNYGTLIIQGGTFVGMTQTIVNNCGMLKIEDTTFEASIGYAIYNNGTDKEKGTVYIYDGLFTGAAEALLYNDGEMYIMDGTFSNTNGEVVRALKGNVVINEGTLQGLYPIGFNDPAVLSISNGTFVSYSGTVIKYLGNNSASITERSYITGGAFSDSVSNYVDPSFTVEVEAATGDTPFTYGKNFDWAVKNAVTKGTGAIVTAINDTRLATEHRYIFNDDEKTLATVVQDRNYDISLPSLTKEGEAFYGWNDGKTVYSGGSTYKVSSNIPTSSYTILSAQWTPPEIEDPTEDPSEDPSGGSEDESNIVVVDKEATGMTVDPDSKLSVAEDDKVRVEVWPVYKRSDEHKTIADKISELSDLTGVYDVTLFVNGIQKTDGFGTITLLFPVDAKYNDRIARVWYIHEGEELEYRYSVVVDGKVSVATSQLSVFGVEILDPSEYPSTEKPGLDSKDPNTQAMYRLYNPNSGEHLYTADEFERDCVEASGWDYEGVAWIAPVKSNTPVYRLYSGTDHHYTTSVDERDMLVNAGWTDEGIGWYSDDAEGVALYRLFNPNVDPSAEENNSGSHHYTADKAESSQLVRNGWQYENIGWYGVKSETVAETVSS